jgi:hypothetical protein
MEEHDTGTEVEACFLVLSKILTAGCLTMGLPASYVIYCLSSAARELLENMADPSQPLAGLSGLGASAILPWLVPCLVILSLTLQVKLKRAPLSSVKVQTATFVAIWAVCYLANEALTAALFSI